MNYQIVTGSTGTYISFIEVYGNATPAAAPTRPSYRRFDNTPRQVLGRQNYKTFGAGQMVIFGWQQLRIVTDYKISIGFAIFTGCCLLFYSYGVR